MTRSIEPHPQRPSQLATAPEKHETGQRESVFITNPPPLEESGVPTPPDATQPSLEGADHFKIFKIFSRSFLLLRRFCPPSSLSLFLHFLRPVPFLLLLLASKMKLFARAILLVLAAGLLSSQPPSFDVFNDVYRIRFAAKKSILRTKRPPKSSKISMLPCSCCPFIVCASFSPPFTEPGPRSLWRYGGGVSQQGLG